MLLMWSAPYTLDNVPITGYNINDDQGTLLDRVNTIEYILTSSNDDPCNVTIVYVSGINGAGIGDSNNVTFYIAKGKHIMSIYMVHVVFLSYLVINVTPYPNGNSRDIIIITDILSTYTCTSKLIQN